MMRRGVHVVGALGDEASREYAVGAKATGHAVIGAAHEDVPIAELQRIAELEGVEGQHRGGDQRQARRAEGQPPASTAFPGNP